MDLAGLSAEQGFALGQMTAWSEALGTVSRAFAAVQAQPTLDGAEHYGRVSALGNLLEEMRTLVTARVRPVPLDEKNNEETQ